MARNQGLFSKASVLKGSSVSVSRARCCFSLLGGALVLSSLFLFANAEASSENLAEILEGKGEWLLPEQKKCVSHNWGAGEAARFAVKIDSELCVAGELGEELPVSAMKTSIWAESVGNGSILESDLNIFAVRAEASMPLSGTPEADAHIFVLGYQVWSDHVRAPEATFERNFTVLNFERAVSAPIKIGPVPGTVTAGMRARLDTDVQGALAVANARANVVPILASGGFVQVAVDAKVAHAGVEGELEFVSENMHLEGSVGLGVNATVRPPVIFYAAEAKGTHNTSALHGKLALFAELLNGGKRFDREFFNFPGFAAEGVMFHTKINPTPIFEAYPSYPEN